MKNNDQGLSAYVLHDIIDISIFKYRKINITSNHLNGRNGNRKGTNNILDDKTRCVTFRLIREP